MRDNIFDIAVHPDLALPALKLGATMLTIDDAPILQKLLDRCSDYFELAAGRPPGPDAALYELTDGPAERIPHDLFCLGLRPEKGELVGIIIVIRHHPLPNHWYLALFLLDPAWRGRTCGKICFLRLKIGSQAKAQKQSSLRLSNQTFAQPDFGNRWDSNYLVVSRAGLWGSAIMC